jgi:GntR family transcriptional regulator of gluconate operon
MGLLTYQAFGPQVAAHLRRRIVSRQLPSGKHLVEDALAAEYQVGRGPVREALKKLETEGLVVARRRGLFVVGLTDADVDELIDLWGAIEALATELAMANAEPAHWAELEDALAEMREAAAAHDPHRFGRADLRFHSTIYQAAGSRRLRDVWGVYSGTVEAILQLSKPTWKDLDEGAESHVALLEPMRRGDLAAAQEELRSHLAGTRRQFLDAVRHRYDGYDSSLADGDGTQGDAAP